MIETLTTAVIVLAISLIGLAFMFGVLLSDHNRRIARLKKDIGTLETAQRDNYSKTGNIEMRHDKVIDDLSNKVERHENTFKALTSISRVARWRSFNKYNIMHEGESPRCEYCLSDDTEYSTEYANIAGSKAPDKLVSQCCKCGQKSTLWRFDSKC